MGSSARDNASTRELKRRVTEGATGRLRIADEANGIHVFVREGQILAAETQADIGSYARMVRRQRLLSEEFIDDILKDRASLNAFGKLFARVPTSAAERILTERFHQNLCVFVGQHSNPAFDSLPSVFVNNLQLGHNAEYLIDMSCAMWDTAVTLDLHAVLVRGTRHPADPLHRVVLAILGEEALTVEELLDELPLENIAARACLLDMLQSGSIAVPVDDSNNLLPAEDEATESTPRVLSGHRLDDIPLDLLDARMDSDLDGLPEEPIQEAPPIRVAPQAPPQRQQKSEAQGLQVPPAVQAPISSAPPPQAPSQGTSALRSVSSWLSDAEKEAGFSDMEAFSDHDYDRGAESVGAFSTQSHNLDRVEVSPIDLRPDTTGHAPVEVATAVDDKAIEADGAPPQSRKFSAPQLSEQEAYGKISVANDVLRSVAIAFDGADGSGRGRAMVQLLVDGSPSISRPLLSELQVLQDGALPNKDMVSNLHTRPASEHRHLLNRTLVDLIERALSSAADELPDDRFDTMYENVAGYRQRLGL